MNILLTGASSGIGAETCRHLVKQGNVVFAIARRLDRLNILHDELGYNLIPIEADITSKDIIMPALKNIREQSEHIDAVVNAAGLALGALPAQECLLEDWDAMIRTNIQGFLNVIHTVLPDMLSLGKGHIINIGSAAGSYPYPGGNVYGATKAFTKHLLLNLKADLLGTGVRVSEIQPGMVSDTEFFNVRFNGDQDKANAISKGFVGLKAADIAQAVLWILNQPQHVNINQIEIMPTNQAFSALSLYRT